MSTRGAIARPKGEGFEGRYHHFDAYPEGLGATLFSLRNGFFGGDTDAMLKVLIDEHPAGWSSINGCDFNLTPGFSEGFDNYGPCLVCNEDSKAHLCQTSGPRTDKHRKGGYPCPAGNGLFSRHLGHEYTPDPKAVELAALTPRCYCHGDRAEDEWLVTAENASASGVEYAYVLEGSRMLVLSSYTQDGEKMIGAFGFGDPDGSWSIIADVDLDGPVPNWDAVSEAAFA